ncbi:MAG: DNA primase [Kiritimatiellae bacterium]|nr:DNA primase [Kiritimatiellia bacterium]
MTSEQAKEEIKARIDLADLISEYGVPIKKRGTSIKACCPFHKEKTPSFNINTQKQFYHCFGCGESGDIFTFVQKMEGIPFLDALRKLAERAGVEITERNDPNAVKRRRLYELHAELAAFYRRCLLQTREAEPARAYLASRKLPDDICEQFGIGYAPTQTGALQKWAKIHKFSLEELAAAGIMLPPAEGKKRFYDRFKGRLMFPIRDSQGRVVAFSGRILDKASSPAKYVNSPATEIFIKGQILFGLDKAARHIVNANGRQAIVCEGQIDVIRCHASGFQTAIASEGTAFTQEHAKLLKKYADSVVLLFDGDAAGQKAAHKCGQILLQEGLPVRVASLPDGHDPDSFLRDLGAQAFQEVLNKSVSLVRFLIETKRYTEVASGRDPNGIDVVRSIEKTILDILCSCPVAILVSTQLQEAADLLHVPISVLEADLETVRETIQKEEESRARFGASKKPETESTEDEPSPSAPSGESDLDEPPITEDLGEPGEDDDGIPAPPPPPSKLEMDVCEFLAECEHDPDVLSFVERYLPLDLFTHPLTRDFAQALFTANKTGEDLLSAFCERYGKEWKEYVSKLIANEQRMLSAREFSKEDAAKELIRKMWIHRYQQQQRELPLDADTPNDILEKRLRLSCIIKDLQTKPWEVIEKILRVATGKDESEANDTQPLNSTHTTPAVYPSTVPPPHDAEAHETSAFDNQPVEEAPSEFLPDDDLPPDLQ